MYQEVVILVILLVVISLATLRFIPKRVYLDESSRIILQSYLGKYKVIPLNEIKLTDIPQSSMNHFTRRLGTKVGKKASGLFYNTALKQQYRLFITGRNKVVCFEYQNQLYLVDSWIISD